MITQINPDNWFYCTLCKIVSYDYDCECWGTYCNCGGCDKCQSLAELVKAAIKNGQAPSQTEAELNNLKKFGNVQTPESKILEDIFVK